MSLTARIEFAPDGKHYHTIKRAKHTMSLWNYFNGSEIRQQLIYNPFAKFRLIGETGKKIGVLPNK